MKDKPVKNKVGRPVTQTKVINKTSEVGTREHETRATFIVNKSLLNKMKAIAYWDRLQIKEVIDKAFNDAVAKYEKDNGPIETAPTK